MTLLLVPAGTFRMGSPPAETERGGDEGPLHEITITRPFYMGIYPVTQRQFEAVMGYNPSYLHASKGGGPDFPVERITWDEAMSFCAKLSEIPAERAAERRYRLPTEAEWEYACRAGVPLPFAFGPVLSFARSQFQRQLSIWRRTRSVSRTHDQSGLLCAQSVRPVRHARQRVGMVRRLLRSALLPQQSALRSAGTGRGKPARRARGSCFNIGRFCRSAYRFGVTPTNRALDIGLRVVMSTPAIEKAES